MSRASKLRKGRPDRVLGAHLAAAALEIPYRDLVRARGAAYTVTVAEARALSAEAPPWLAEARHRAQERREQRAARRARQRTEEAARWAADGESLRLDALYQEVKEQLRAEDEYAG
ncbi:hypothetical protein [Streptomyces sp. NPDC018045]|uniref:hypothetical protein n=1 Tax=Streptomyces sp. NPDC018045 TaxID=3365037 RepID=UPI0037AE09F4